MPNNKDMLTFSEATKTSRKAFNKDAVGILWVVKNRVNRPKRFGASEDEVIFAPKQFTGVGGNEWNKAATGKLTEDEQWYLKRASQLRKAVDEGKIPDPTGGADHYYNPKLADPNWGKVYEKTYSSGAHDFHSELKTKNKPKETIEFKEAFSLARESGKKTFMWKGKKYTTKLAK